MRFIRCRNFSFNEICDQENGYMTKDNNRLQKMAGDRPQWNPDRLRHRSPGTYLSLSRTLYEHHRHILSDALSYQVLSFQLHSYLLTSTLVVRVYTMFFSHLFHCASDSLLFFSSSFVCIPLIIPYQELILSH